MAAPSSHTLLRFGLITAVLGALVGIVLGFSLSRVFGPPSRVPTPARPHAKPKPSVADPLTAVSTPAAYRYVRVSAQMSVEGKAGALIDALAVVDSQTQATRYASAYVDSDRIEGPPTAACGRPSAFVGAVRAGRLGQCIDDVLDGGLVHIAPEGSLLVRFDPPFHRGDLLQIYEVGQCTTPSGRRVPPGAVTIEVGQSVSELREIAHQLSASPVITARVP